MAWNQRTFNDDPSTPPQVLQTFAIAAVTGACSGAALTLLILRIGGWL